jgi:hypothetical protein
MGAFAQTNFNLAGAYPSGDDHRSLLIVLVPTITHPVRELRLCRACAAALMGDEVEIVGDDTHADNTSS